MSRTLQITIERYDQEKDQAQRMQTYTLDTSLCQGVMVLDALIAIKNNLDETLSFRRSCKEGVCGSDGMNINGKNMLACITPLSLFSDSMVIKPFPGMPVIRDLIVDMTQFYAQYEKAKPFLINNNPPPAKERLQTPKDREKLDGLYECIMCGCCSSACPSYWWNPDKFLGPAALLQAARFILDTRDTYTQERLDQLSDAYSVFKCRSIMNCVDVCLKGLNPTKAISEIRTEMLQRDT